MEYSKDGFDLTKQFEGCKLSAYQDGAGVWTIGYGHTLGVYPGMTCSQSHADAFLMGDIQHVVDEVNARCTVNLTQGQFDALVDFGFNLGTHALETSTLWKKLMDGDFDGAAQEFPRWDKCNGLEVRGLLRRRYAEQREFT